MAIKWPFNDHKIAINGNFRSPPLSAIFGSILSRPLMATTHMSMGRGSTDKHLSKPCLDSSSNDKMCALRCLHTQAIYIEEHLGPSQCMSTSTTLGWKLCKIEWEKQTILRFELVLTIRLDQKNQHGNITMGSTKFRVDAKGFFVMFESFVHFSDKVAHNC